MSAPVITCDHDLQGQYVVTVCGFCPELSRHRFKIRPSKYNFKCASFTLLAIRPMMDNGNNRNLWYEHKKLQGSSKSYPLHVDDATENGQITDVFSQKYNALYNSVPSDNEEMMRIKHSIQKDLLQYNNTDHVVNVSGVVGAVSKLQKNKSDGEAGLWSNHIIYAPHRYRVHICMLLTGLSTWI